MSALGFDRVASFERRAVLGDALMRALPPLLGVATVGGLAASNGGYFLSTCAWASLGLLWFSLIALLLRSEVSIGLLGLVLLGGLALFAGWSALSWFWTSSVTLTMADVQKLLVYVGVVLAALLVVSRRTVPSLLAGVLTGIVLVCAYALATRLFPERLGTFDALAGYRLTRPVGYWNALGLFAGMGVVLAAGFAARASRIAWRGLAAAPLPLLMATFFFTFSRGAWVALGVGVLVALVLDPRRLQLLFSWLVLAPWPALAVVLADRSHALTTTGAALSAASHQGHRLVLWIVLLAAVAALVAVLLGAAEQELSAPRWLRSAFATGVVLAVLAGAGAVWVHYGSPTSLARRAYHSFRAPPKAVHGHLSGRLLSLSSNGRIDLWRVAWRQFERNPVAGTGAGTYQMSWYAHRPYPSQALDAHGLYQQTLSELGVVGLVLLGVALLAPLAAAVRARRNALVPVACAAYVAFLAHNAVDWDWQLTGVGAVGLLCGAALVVSARVASARPALTLELRAAALAATAALTAFAFVSVMANVPLRSAQTAQNRGDWSASAAEARKAKEWAPWSSEPLRLLGEAQLAQSRAADARQNFRAALAKDPRSWQLWVDLALVSTRAAKNRALSTAERLNPLDPSLPALGAKRGKRP